MNTGMSRGELISALRSDSSYPNLRIGLIVLCVLLVAYGIFALFTLPSGTPELTYVILVVAIAVGVFFTYETYSAFIDVTDLLAQIAASSAESNQEYPRYSVREATRTDMDMEVGRIRLPVPPKPSDELVIKGKTYRVLSTKYVEDKFSSQDVNIHLIVEQLDVDPVWFSGS